MALHINFFGILGVSTAFAFGDLIPRNKRGERTVTIIPRLKVSHATYLEKSSRAITVPQHNYTLNFDSLFIFVFQEYFDLAWSWPQVDELGNTPFLEGGEYNLLTSKTFLIITLNEICCQNT